MASSGSSKGTRFSKQFRINSSNRVRNSSSTDSNFSIYMGDNLKKVKTLSITAVSFFNAMYNIFNEASRFNNVFILRWTPNVPGPDTVANITIRPGYYTVSQLYNEIITQVAASAFGLNFTFTYNPIRNHVLVVSDVGAYAAGVLRMYTPTQDELNTKTVTESPISKLGFTSGNIIPFAPAAPLEAGDAPNMVRTQIAYIKSAALAPSNAFDEEGKTVDFLIAIPVNVPFASQVLWECKQDKLCQNEFGITRDLSQIDIQLVDHDDYPLDLDGTPLNIELRIWYDQY